MPMPVNAPRVWGRVADFFRLQGKHPLMLDETTVPVIVIADFTAEEARVEDAATYAMFINADVLGPSKAVLLNDSAGTRMLVDRISYSAGTTTRPVVTLSNTAPVTPIAAGTADKTWNNRLQTGDPPGEMFADRGAFVGPDVYVGNHVQNTPLHIDAMLVLDPGEQVVISGSDTNASIRVVLNVRVVSLR